MENQHRKISGYRDLNEAEIAAMNEIKASAANLEALISSISNRPEVELDQRWAAIAQTDLQKGFMALVRAVAKPSTF